MECYTDGVYHQIAEMVYADLDAGRAPEPAAVMNRFLDEEEERNQVAAVFNTSLSSDYTEEEQEKIFGEFARLSGTEKEEGFGLGLSITRKLID